MKKPCLVIIDLMVDFLDRWEAVPKAGLIARTNRLVATFRQARLPVIWVRQEFRADLGDAFLEMRDRNIAIAIEETAGAQLHPDLDWRSTDITIIKKRYSAFFGTGLDDILVDLDIDGMVLAGVNTHACVRTTAIDAYQRDLRVALVRECIGSYDELHAKVTLDYLDDKIARLLSLDEVIEVALASR